MEDGEKSVFASFFGWPEIRECVKKVCFVVAVVLWVFMCVLF